jgi:transposase
MAKPLSEDLRIRIIRAVEEEGMSRRAAAKRFDVSASSAIRAVADWRASGKTAAKGPGGDQRSGRIEAHHDAIMAMIETKRDLTLTEIADLLEAECGERFAPSSIWRFFDRHDVSFKKNRARSRAG